jgi:hypothetical protein
VCSEPLPDAMADLVRRLPYDGRIRHAKDERYLAWRFGNPQSRYRFVYAGGKQLEGYLVLSAILAHTWVSIVDWEATAPSVLREMLRRAMEWGSFRATYVFHATLRSDQVRILHESGFQPPGDSDRHSGKILVKLLAEDDSAENWSINGRSPLEAENWDLRMIMHDVF